jgi:hypothetical protein
VSPSSGETIRSLFVDCLDVVASTASTVVGQLWIKILTEDVVGFGFRSDRHRLVLISRVLEATLNAYRVGVLRYSSTSEFPSSERRQEAIETRDSTCRLRD